METKEGQKVMEAAPVEAIAIGALRLCYYFNGLRATDYEPPKNNSKEAGRAALQSLASLYGAKLEGDRFQHLETNGTNLRAVRIVANTHTDFVIADQDERKRYQLATVKPEAPKKAKAA